MNPPIKVHVRTNNLDTCEMLISGDDGVATSIKIPSQGSVYQGLHAVREQLETTLNDILAMHGITPPSPPSVKPEFSLADFETEVATKREELTALEKKLQLEDEKRHIEADLAAAKAEDAKREKLRAAETAPAPATETKPTTES